MIILTLRTDKPEAEIGLYKDSQRLAYHTWQAHRQLSETIHTEIDNLINSQDYKLEDLEGIAVFAGPGSFTGLRIGAAVANSLAVSLGLNIVSTSGEDWLNEAVKSLEAGKTDGQVLPVYGSEARTTVQKK